jgi:hypothetical protein
MMETTDDQQQDDTTQQGDILIDTTNIISKVVNERIGLECMSLRQDQEELAKMLKEQLSSSISEQAAMQQKMQLQFEQMQKLFNSKFERSTGDNTSLTGVSFQSTMANATLTGAAIQPTYTMTGMLGGTSFDNVAYATMPGAAMNNQSANVTFQGAAVPTLPTLQTAANTTQMGVAVQQPGAYATQAGAAQFQGFVQPQTLTRKNLCSDDDSSIASTPLQDENTRNIKVTLTGEAEDLKRKKVQIADHLDQFSTVDETATAAGSLKHLYENLAGKYTKTSDKKAAESGPEIQSTVALAAKAFWTRYSAKEDVKKKLAEVSKIPENCSFLNSRDVNPEFWEKLKGKEYPREVRDVDTNYRAVQKLHNAESSIIMQAAATLVEYTEAMPGGPPAELGKVNELLMAALQMGGRVHQKFDSARRANLRPHIDKAYKGLTENTSPESEFLFQSLPEMIKSENKKIKAARALTEGYIDTEKENEAESPKMKSVVGNYYSSTKTAPGRGNSGQYNQGQYNQGQYNQNRSGYTSGYQQGFSSKQSGQGKRQQQGNNNNQPSKKSKNNSSSTPNNKPRKN